MIVIENQRYTFPKWVKIICVSPKYVLFIL
nr:MAG TPA: hypothetical protein [Caudoviricetes sp.]DAT61099.1 MAG TPA: hypothetical protein [Caudoviricetes sp.]